MRNDRDEKVHTSTEIAFDEASVAAAEDAAMQCQLACEAIDVRFDRLIETAFENSARAKRAIDTYAKARGIESAITMLNDETLVARAYYCGFLRGHLFARGERQAAREALQEIPEVLRERHLLHIRRRDLLETKRRVLDRTDHARLAGERQDGNTRPREHGRTRSR